MLTLGWSDGSTFLPVNSILLSTENKKNRINEAAEVDKEEPLVTGAESCLWKREPMPCLHFWKLLKSRNSGKICSF